MSEIDYVGADLSGYIAVLGAEYGNLAISSQVHFTKIIIDFAIHGNKQAAEYLAKYDIELTGEDVTIKADPSDYDKHSVGWDHDTDTLWINGCDCGNKFVGVRRAIILAAMVQSFVEHIAVKSAKAKEVGKS